MISRTLFHSLRCEAYVFSSSFVYCLRTPTKLQLIATDSELVHLETTVPPSLRVMLDSDRVYCVSDDLVTVLNRETLEFVDFLDTKMLAPGVYLTDTVIVTSQGTLTCPIGKISGHTVNESIYLWNDQGAVYVVDKNLNPVS